MTRRAYPLEQKSKLGDATWPEENPWPKRGRAGLESSTCVALGNRVFQAEWSLALLEKIAQPVASQPEQWPTPVPLLGHLVPGAESCVIFFFDPVKRQLFPKAVANISQEFITAIADHGQGQRLIMAAAKQAKPYLVVYLPGNRQFRSLWKSAQKEGIRTLWLVPWHDGEGSVFGVFVFASREAFSPSKEALAAVTLLTAWMSTVLRQAGAGQKDGGLENTFEYGSEPRMTVEDVGRIAAMDHVARELSRSWQDQMEEDGQTTHVFTDSTNPSPTALPMYEDKDGIPVLYDSRTNERRKPAELDPAGVLSHELLSPLTLIKGYTATLLQLGEAITKEQKGQYLKSIESATNRVIRLLENLRDVTQLGEADSYTLEPTSLLDSLRQTVSDMQSQTKKHVIKLSPFAPLPQVKVDQQKIEQVLTNILVNAIKYSPQGGDIEATIRLVRHEDELEEFFGEAPSMRLPCLMVSVSDSGIGIPEAELGRIFERFYRVNNRLTRTIPGAGLGLYICKLIVEAHGGRIWARNRLEGGCTFSFSLPL